MEALLPQRPRNDFNPEWQLNEIFLVDKRQIQRGNFASQRKVLTCYIVTSSMLILILVALGIHYTKDILTSDDAMVAWLAAAICRQIALIIALTLLLTFILVVSIEAYRSPQLLLDQAYQKRLYKYFIRLLAFFYLVLFSVFFQQPLSTFFNYCLGFKMKVKDTNSTHGKKPKDKTDVE